MQVPPPSQPPFPWQAIGAFSALVGTILTIVVTWLRDRAAGTKRIQVLDEASKYLAFLKARQEILPIDSVEESEREAANAEIARKVGLIDRYVELSVTKIIENRIARHPLPTTREVYPTENYWSFLRIYAKGVAWRTSWFLKRWGGEVATFILVTGLLAWGGVAYLRYQAAHEPTLAEQLANLTEVHFVSSKEPSRRFVIANAKGVGGWNGTTPQVVRLAPGLYRITCVSSDYHRPAPSNFKDSFIDLFRLLNPPPLPYVQVEIQRTSTTQEIDCDTLQPNQPTQPPTTQK